MPYLVQYQMRYQEINGDIINVNISQTSSSGAGTPVVTDLVAATENPFTVQIIDNDKDKFKPIRGKQATINFVSQPSVTAFTFSTGADDEWLVTATVEGSGFILFKGYLVMDDHEGKFLPVGTYPVQLIATDNIATLKTINLTDETGAYITGYQKIIYYISQALRKTNLQLDIIVTDTYFEENTTDFLPACDQVYLHAKTFEKDIHEAIDCYSVLERILKFNSTLFQYNGQWWISHVDERTQNNTYLFQFDYTGVYVAQLVDAPYNQAIGKTQDLKFIGADAIVKEVRPYKSVKLTYNYDFPKEIIDNIDFSRGTTLYTPLDMSPVTIDGVTYYQSKYHIDDWVELEGSGGVPGTGTTSSTKSYIRKLYVDSGKTYEKQRYVVIEHTLSGGTFFIKSAQFPVNALDKFTISVDAKYQSDVFPSSGYYKFQTIQVRLLADDGTFYTLNGGFNADPTTRWVVTGSSFSSSNQYVYQEGQLSEDLTEWKTSGADAPPVPKGGLLQILLIHDQNSSYQTDRWFNNLQFNYDPYINGSYSKYSGQSTKISQSGNYKATIDEQIYLSDSPIKLAKGAMFRKVGSAYVLTKGWFAGGDLLRQGLLTAYPPSSIYIHPYSYLQTYALWNQYNRPMRQLSGNINGVLVGSVPDLNTNLSISTTTGESDNKSFIATSIEYDYRSGKARIEISETDDTVLGRDYSSPLEFKYTGGNG